MKALLWMWSCHNEDIFAKKKKKKKSTHPTSWFHPGKSGESGGWRHIPCSILTLAGGSERRGRKWHQWHLTIFFFLFSWEEAVRWEKFYKKEAYLNIYRRGEKKKNKEMKQKKNHRVVWPLEVASHFTSSSAILSLTVILKFNKCSLFVLADFKQIHL